MRKVNFTFLSDLDVLFFSTLDNVFPNINHNMLFQNVQNQHYAQILFDVNGKECVKMDNSQHYPRISLFIDQQKTLLNEENDGSYQSVRRFLRRPNMC